MRGSDRHRERTKRLVQRSKLEERHRVTDEGVIDTAAKCSMVNSAILLALRLVSISTDIL